MRYLPQIFNKQFFTFATIGVFNTVLDFSVYFWLTRWLHFGPSWFIYANVISASVAIMASYYLNSRLTFARGLRIERFIKFVVVSLFGLFLNTTILFFATMYLGWFDLVSKLAAILVVLFWNFFINKLWTFK